jgi:hypothetical protein
MDLKQLTMSVERDILLLWLIGGMVYTGDLKSPARLGLRVRVPHQLPFSKILK